jgi:hypothetical protein
MAKWVRPTLNTKYHIDFDWWAEQGLNFRSYLSSQLCDECKPKYADARAAELVDWVDPVTAEVKRVDALWQALKSCCSTRADYIAETTPLTTAIFRMFLANDNTPLSPAELAENLAKRGSRRYSAEDILRTLSRGPIYRGIKPVPTE